jgi:hypothetical protein
MSVHHPKWFFAALITIATLLLGSCSSLPLERFFPGIGSDQTSIPLVEVTFYVQVPANTPDGEIIYLSILDEVTGLGVNADAHPLEAAIGEENVDQGLTYKTTLTVPLNSIIKYRYTRQNQYAVIEHTQADEQVRYRLAVVNNPLEIRDVVSKWSDTSYYWPEPGRISGKITDSQTAEPVPGMLVAAGGAQAFTTADGSFMLPGLPPGVHNLVVFAADGAYQEIQQGAEVASQANTEANLSIIHRDFVDVTFLVTVPIGTPENSVRLAGNLYQLGNTFGNLPGGMNTIPARMPRLTNAGDNRYGIILSLPVGAEILYKYSLGDGFWNAEHAEDGSFVIRRMIVPDHATQVDDQVLTWKSSTKDSITFDLWTPDYTPPGEAIYIQFNPYGWTTPLPMTELAPNHWVFILFSPFNVISDLSYRYCRQAECGTADDAATAGLDTGRLVTPSAEPQYIADTVESWSWLEEEISWDPIPLPPITARGEDFLTGVELMPGSKADDSAQIISSIPAVASLNPGWIFLTPTWTFTHQIPPVIEPNPNQDPLWLDLADMTRAASSAGLKVALDPQPHFPQSSDAWWESASRDFGWWNSWFDQYRTFAVHFAEAAEKQGVDMLVLGGDWLQPALPGGKLTSGEPSGVPADAEMRWSEILQDVDSRFSGTIAWVVTLPQRDRPPAYLEYVDQVHINWNPSLPTAEDASLEEFSTAALASLDGKVNPFWADWLKADDKLLVLRLAYPSVQGWSPDCDAESGAVCHQLSDFASPAPSIPDLERDYTQQAKAYTALISAAVSKNWVSGIVSEGYYAPVILHDKSISIHGKPSEVVVSQWYSAEK